MKKEEEFKSKVLCCRITPEQHKKIMQLMSKTGKGKSVCVREILDASFKRITPNFEDKSIYFQRKELINEINKIGTNINQIVHNINMEYYTDYDKSKLFALMKKLNDIVAEKL